MNTRFTNAKILCTKEDQSFEIRSGELWVEQDRITYIGDGADAPEGREVAWDREIDADGDLLMPGFKNAHAHTYMTFLRSYADDLPLQEWLYHQCFPKEEQLNPENIRPFEILGIMEYLTGGITAGFDMCYFPPVYAEVAASCGFRAVQVSGVNSFGGLASVVEENYLRVNETSDLTTFMIGFHAEYTTKPELMKEIAGLAHKYQSPVFLHNSETRQEVSECIDRYGMTPTQLTDEMDMYAYGGGGFHCIYFDEKDFEIFQKRGLTAVTCPASNLKLASGIAPLKAFADRGINVAIGTDGPASNNALDMFREMYLAATLAKVREQDAACIPAEKILYMATAGGARAMQLADCDCLAAGKKADLIRIGLKQPNMQPENNLVTNLVYSGSRQNVVMTMIDGRILYENGRFLFGIDPADVYREANAVIRSMK